MTAWRLVLDSLRHFWRTNLGVVLGAACAAAVLVGALAVGDSVRLSLRDQALNRIGDVEAALSVRERYFRADLADRIAEDLAGARVAPVIQLSGISSTGGGSARAGIVDVFGVDGRFFAASPASGGREPPAPGYAFVNERLAEQLGVVPGDEILLRVEKPSYLPRDMVMATIDDVSHALRMEVGAVVGEADFGRFSLRASQIPPFDLFVSLPWLQEQLDLVGRANLLLLDSPGETEDVVEQANDAVRSSWSLADAELRLQGKEGLFQLSSDRVFIEKPVVDVVAGLAADLEGVLAYFVNEIRAGARATPYSMVAAIGPLSGRSGETGTSDIVLNEWLAEDLQAGVGDPVELAYFVMGPDLRLGEATHAFRVSSVVPVGNTAAAAELMPAFPGLIDTENCRDWEPGIPIDLDRIRDVDEEYWDEHRGTPKAFIDLPTGQALWSNRFGSLTAIRGPEALAGRVEERILRDLDPASVGLYFQDIRGPALAAGTSATDFGGLFLGLSFFLILAALLLTSLLFVFGVEQRANEIGALLALGFRPATVRRLFLLEALGLAIIGGALGSLLGLGYTRAVLTLLGSLWRDAVGATTLTFHAVPTTVVTGAVISVVTALIAIALTLRKTFHRPAVELLTSRNGIGSSVAATPARGRISLVLAVGGPALALLIVLFAGTSSAQAAGAFFAAAALLLIGGMGACRALLGRIAGLRSAAGSVSALGLRNSGRRPGRSLATIALLASGTFLVVSVQAYRLSPPSRYSERGSGTGGFALFGRSTLPVLRDLGTPTGRDAYGLFEEDLAGASIVPLRVRDGDDASCLNLSLPQNPRLIGVRPSALAERGAFQFAEVPAADSGERFENPWLALDADWGPGVVPAVGDQASVQWTLHKSVGDSLPYTDERGREFQVRIVGTIANSILQGNLVVSEQNLQERYPSESGYRMFLIDAAPDAAEDVATNLTWALEDIGLEVTPTTARLAAFNAVQNTYLLIFQALGGLGLLLGSIGLGMVVLRNALERRSELAIASAVGFPSRRIRQLVWSEHGLLLGLGLGSGVLAALVAVLPGSQGPGLSAPMALLVTAVALSGVVWVWVASTLATRGTLLNALRDD